HRRLGCLTSLRKRRPCNAHGAPPRPPCYTRKIMDLNEMLIFTRVVAAQSFTAGAQKLGMPKSSVTRKVSALEARLGVRLLQRPTRKLVLTDVGRIYYERCARIIGEIEEAEQAVSRTLEVPCGPLRVTAPLAFRMLGPIVAEFLTRYPNVQVEL